MSEIKVTEDLSKLYDRSYYHGDAYEDYSLKRLGPAFIEKTKLVKKFCARGSRLLDVGCALGYFVKCALDEGFDAYGIDFSGYAVEQASRLVGDRAKYGDVEEGIPFENDFFDVVTAWDLLEHLRYPNRFLQEVNRISKKDGSLFITTLNNDSLVSRIMKERWTFAVPSYHQTPNITPKGLRNWLDQAGFEVISLYTFGFALESFSARIDVFLFRELGRALEKALRLEIYALLRLLRPFNLGDTTLCVARRRHLNV